ncbi:MAG: hypothetical protein ACOCWQ_04455, partial [Nanoarchaeota archaeon]
MIPYTQLMQIIRAKQEFSMVDDDYIRMMVDEEVRLHPHLAKDMAEVPDAKLPRNRSFKHLVKHVRQRLRPVYGIYHKDATKRDELVRAGK